MSTELGSCVCVDSGGLAACHSQFSSCAKGHLGCGDPVPQGADSQALIRKSLERGCGLRNCGFWQLERKGLASTESPVLQRAVLTTALKEMCMVPKVLPCTGVPPSACPRSAKSHLSGKSGEEGLRGRSLRTTDREPLRLQASGSSPVGTRPPGCLHRTPEPLWG